MRLQLIDMDLSMSRLEYQSLERGRKIAQTLQKNPYEIALWIKDLDSIYGMNTVLKYMQDNNLTYNGLNTWKIKRKVIMQELEEKLLEEDKRLNHELDRGKNK